jgi:hypothetical protein
MASAKGEPFRPSPGCGLQNHFFSSMPAVGPVPFFITQQKASVLPHFLQVC